DVTTSNPRANIGTNPETNIGMNPVANPNKASVSSRSPHSLPLPYAPFYDPEFAPMILMVKAYRNLLKEHRAHSYFTFSVTRNGIPVETVRLEIMEHHERTRVYVERILKTYLWILGGNGLILDGPKHLVAHIAEQYSPQGKRNFDVQFFSEVFGRAFEITEGAPDSHPDTQPRQCEDRISARESLPQSLRSKTANVRIGIDLGGSTLKITVLKDNQVLHRAGYAWTPKVQSHPDYHYREITSAVRKALELTQINPNEVASIGISSAGIVLDNAVIASSLFRAVPENLKEEVRVLFERVSREFGNIPYQIVNDGEIAALAGKTAERSEAILGLTLGTSLGCGYIDTDGKLTNQINELAFVPLDISDSAIIDEWSGDRGAGVSYLSQDAAIKLAVNAGLFLPGETPSQQFQYLAQLLTTEPGTKTDEKPGTKLEPEQGRRQKIAERIFDDMGIYLGYAIAYYREFYAFRHLLLLGGVVAGRHGERIVQSAKQVLSREFPDISENVEFVSVEHASHIQDFVAAQMDQ
ncbi:MAG: ROK family protein, partial [Bacillota bacterium]|nr:ROK family protein [Bacillota bacterium]